MKAINTISIIVIILLSVVNVTGQHKDQRYLINDGRYGYINQMGAVIVKPQFISAGQFSEGLAAVRLNGTYGYIDTNGAFVISSKYDFALSFYNGQAEVFIDGKPFFIDRTGKIIFDHNYKSIAEFEHNSYAIVVTQTDKYGVINRMGKLVCDTAFKKINVFKDGVAVVEGFNNSVISKKSKIAKFKIGLIDSLGNWIVRYGKYRDITGFREGESAFQNGLAEGYLTKPIKQKNGSLTDHVVIDNKGIRRFTFSEKGFNFCYKNEGFQDGVAVVEFPIDTKNTVDDLLPWLKPYYIGVIDQNGKTLFSDTNWVYVTPFVNNRAFAKDKLGKWKLIDKKGKQVGDSMFDAIIFPNMYLYQCIPNSPFLNGIAFVKANKNCYTIDSAGKLVMLSHDFDLAQYQSIVRSGDFLILEKGADSTNGYRTFYGFYCISNRHIATPAYYRLNIFNELVYAENEREARYMKFDGVTIWKHNKTIDKDRYLNIDYMHRIEYYSAREGQKGWADFYNRIGSDSIFSTNSGTHSPNKLQLIISPISKAELPQSDIHSWHGGIQLFVANNSTDTSYFMTIEGALYLKLQAQDKYGNWKDIEYYPEPICGRSFYMHQLGPDEYWKFTLPRYEGEFKTKIRAELVYRKNKNGEDNILYSNIVDGSVNPGQFWLKR